MTTPCDTYAGPIADWYDDWLSGFSNVHTLTDSSLYQEGHVYVFRAHK
jgi:hypothetical protein